jgi:hypothetical protein
MPRPNRRRSKRIRNLVTVSSLTAIVLSVSTYAWFIGMRTVNVSSFDVEIASTDSLMLSLDGQAWDTTIDISDTTYNTYEGNTNTWGGRGLIPMSSVGDMDTAASRMKLYEKASLTTTAGGYRLMSSRVNNTGATEQDGYVAFDLFIKNFSGTQYIETLNPRDEEAIYLTTDSSAEVALDGGGIAGTGIENTVRVAFGQVGRVAGTTNDQLKITSINCSPAAESGVTGICRTAQIWEPNDKAHTANAISWYNTSCLKRTGADVTLLASYGSDPVVDKCGTVVNGTTYPTYAVRTAIASDANVDVYDGTEYNGYTASIGETQSLYAYPFFTDSMKILTGTQRPQFMTLAPNSITKVRVYIYIEGQDVDNYDFASIGKKISVKFGFTKERYTDQDINYTGNGGPSRHIPIITLLGNVTETVTVGGTYTDAGATADDNVDGDLTADIVKTGTVDTNTVGSYTITYNVSDNAGNSATPVTRTVEVVAQ